MNMVSLETEIRKLRPANLSKLAELLSPHLWKTVMGNIKKPGSRIEPMFTSEHIAMIETAATKQRKSASEIFLDEWGTMGRERPTIGATIELLVETELFRAADYLAVEVMKGTAPDRPAEGPAAAIRIPAGIDEYNRRDDSSDEDYRAYRNVIEKLDNHDADNPTFSHCTSDEIGNDITSPVGKFERLDGELNPANGISNSSTLPVSLLPNLSALRLGSEQNLRMREETSVCHLQNYPQEVASSELPLCINDRAVLSPFKGTVCDSEHHISYTNSVSLANTNESSEDCTLPVVLMQHNESRKQENGTQINGSVKKNIINYDELPLTVVEFGKN